MERESEKSEVSHSKKDGGEIKGSSEAEIQKVEKAYQERIEYDINEKKHLLSQSLENQRKLQNKSADESLAKLERLKAETVGLHEALTRMPYIQERGDSIGIAMSLKDLKEHSDGSEEYLSFLVSYSNDLKTDIDNQEEVLREYDELQSLLDTQITNEKQKISESSVDVTKRIKSSIALNSEREEQLMKHLKTLLKDYLGPIFWAKEDCTDEELDFRLAESFKLVQSLLNAMSNPEDYDNGYVELVGPPDHLLKQLLKGDFLTEKDNFTKVKLRSFGFGFDQHNPI